jgi:murein DD-endopeptidase MepM/ murein hydrolase activator NlpD
MLRPLAAAAIALALGTGTASADTFALVPEAPVAPSGPVVLPSADTPNAAGSLLLPPAVFEAPFLPVRVLSYDELQALWLRAGTAYGIPWQVLAAINKIESNFGRNMGPSSAGAVGWMQFIPDTWHRWGMDGSGDGIANPWDPEDAVYAAARYLAAAGGREDVPRSIFAYNHAQWYVDDVLELAALFGGGDPGLAGAGSDVVFTLDRLAIAVEETQARAAALTEQLAAAEAIETEAAAKAESTAALADDLELLVSDRALAAKDAFQAEQELLAASAEVGRLRGELEQAEADLEAAQNGAHSASFAPAAAGVLRMPTRADGYVFPVAGGPSVVSVGRDHHDYPAADIAAPHGAPVHALADAVVVSLVEDERCGTGLTLRTLDGLEWVYCHLSYRDPGLFDGSALVAGQWVGLVGSTGNSTGPHLHLGLDPSRYPQEMPWFQEFAGIAFTWQGTAAAPALRTTPIFALVPEAAVGDEAAGDVVEFTLERG